jgi:DNA-binding NtrC family response regulator
MEKLKVLVLDSQDQCREFLCQFLCTQECNVYSTGCINEAFDLIREGIVDVSFIDISIADSDGIDLIERAVNLCPSMTTIAVAGNADPDLVIDIFLAGANDFLIKPFGISKIKKALERTRQFEEMQKRHESYDMNYNIVCSQLKEKLKMEIVGVSQAMKKVIDLVSKVARSESTTVLITGESGTGKELIARGIHAMSSRSKNFLHCVNCSAVPETLFESEFFGHKKGSFTGAFESTVGWFEISQNGTLFLDEVSEMPMNLQAKFLRVLEDKVVSKIGTKKGISLDLRIIAATNQNLEKMVASKRFRIDLYHRISPFIINIPPLRDRTEDIPELINYFTGFFSRKLGKKIRQVDDKVYMKLLKYHFPGNIRELRNIIERAVIISDGEILKVRNLNFSYANAYTHFGNFQPKNDFSLANIEKDVIIKALNRSKYNKTKAAGLLDITRQALDRKIQKYMIAVDQ